MDVMALRRGLLELITHTSGGDPIPAGCEIGVFEVDEVTLTYTVNHSLGEIPKYAAVFCIPNSAWSSIVNPTSTSTMLIELLGNSPANGDFDVSYPSPAQRIDQVYSYNSTGDGSYYGNNTYTTYPVEMTSTQVTFVTGRYYNVKFVPNHKYVYIIIK